MRDIGLLVIGLIVGAVLANILTRCGGAERAGMTHCDTIVYHDTITHYQPIPREEKPVGTVTDRLALAKPQKSGNITSKNIPIFGNIDAKNIPTSVEDFEQKKENTDIEPITDKEDFVCKQDSADVEIPITQKVYEDSTYKAYVSGYQPSLDSITVYPRREVVTIYKDVKPKRWSIGVQAGYGINAEPYIGIGVSYAIWAW